VRLAISKLEETCLKFKTFQFMDLLAYVLWVINELGKFSNKNVKGFRLNYLLKLNDAKSAKQKDLTVMYYLVGQFGKSRPDIMQVIKDCLELCDDDTLKEMNKICTLIPKATTKLFDIFNTLKKMETRKEFIEGMTPLSKSLRADLLDLNKQLEGLDKHIVYYGGIVYDVCVYKDKPTIKDIIFSWQGLLKQGILEPSEVEARIKRESERFAFFNEIRLVFSSLLDAEKFQIENRLEEEKQARIKARREATEAAKQAKLAAKAALKEGASHDDDEVSPLDIIKANQKEQKELELSKVQCIRARKLWKRVLLSHQAASFFRNPHAVEEKKGDTSPISIMT